MWVGGWGSILSTFFFIIGVVYIYKAPKCSAAVCSSEQAYVHGPYFIRPGEVEHVPTRLFYHHEVFRSSIEDTNPMSSIARSVTLYTCLWQCTKIYISDTFASKNICSDVFVSYFKRC